MSCAGKGRPEKTTDSTSGCAGSSLDATRTACPSIAQPSSGAHRATTVHHPSHFAGRVGGKVAVQPLLRAILIQETGATRDSLRPSFRCVRVPLQRCRTGAGRRATGSHWADEDPEGSVPHHLAVLVGVQLPPTTQPGRRLLARAVNRRCGKKLRRPVIAAHSSHRQRTAHNRAAQIPGNRPDPAPLESAFHLRRVARKKVPAEFRCSGF